MLSKNTTPPPPTDMQEPMVARTCANSNLPPPPPPPPPPPHTYHTREIVSLSNEGELLNTISQKGTLSFQVVITIAHALEQGFKSPYILQLTTTAGLILLVFNN
jgi:hypothetical protein